MFQLWHFQGPIASEFQFLEESSRVARPCLDSATLLTPITVNHLRPFVEQSTSDLGPSVSEENLMRFAQAYDRAPAHGTMQYTHDLVNGVECGHYYMRRSSRLGVDLDTERCFLYERTRAAKIVRTQIDSLQRHPIEVLAGDFVYAQEPDVAETKYNRWAARYPTHATLTTRQAISLWAEIQDQRPTWRDVQREVLENFGETWLRGIYQQYLVNQRANGVKSNYRNRSIEEVFESGIHVELTEEGRRLLRAQTNGAGGGCSVIEALRDKDILKVRVGGVSLGMSSKLKLFPHDAFDHGVAMSLLRKSGIFHKYEDLWSCLMSPEYTNPFSLAGELAAYVGFGMRSLLAGILTDDYEPTSWDRGLAPRMGRFGSKWGLGLRLRYGDRYDSFDPDGLPTSADAPTDRELRIVLEDINAEFGSDRLKSGPVFNRMRDFYFIPATPEYLRFVYDALTELKSRTSEMKIAIDRINLQSEDWLLDCQRSLERGDEPPSLIVTSELWENDYAPRNLSPETVERLRGKRALSTLRSFNLCESD